jgi:hypothetical protein
MSEHEDETPPFEDMSFSSDDLTFAEPAAETFLGEESAEPGNPLAAAEPAEGEEAVVPVEETSVEAEAEAAEALAEDVEEDAQPKKPSKTGLILPWVVVALVCVAIYLTFTFSGIHYAPWHACYAILMTLLIFAAWTTRKIWTTFEVTALYTFALGAALAALMTGVYCLGLELCAYQWDLTATQGKKAQAARGLLPPTTSAPARAPAPASGAAPLRAPAAAPAGMPAPGAARAPVPAAPPARAPMPGAMPIPAPAKLPAGK